MADNNIPVCDAIPILLFNVGKTGSISDSFSYKNSSLHNKLVGCLAISGQIRQIFKSWVLTSMMSQLHSKNSHYSIDNAHWVARLHPKNLVTQSISAGRDSAIFSSTSKFKGFDSGACRGQACVQAANAVCSKAFDTVEHLGCFDDASRFTQHNLSPRASQSAG